jgi:LPXTG-motif cell wall-anchored protein
MSVPLTLLAEADQPDQMLLLKTMGHTGWAQTGIIFAAIGFVAVVTFALVYLFRKKILRRHRHHHHHRSTSAAVAPGQNPAAEENGRGKKRWRRSRRPLNPTLAQTRGLPPLRDENTPPPVP